MRSFIVMLFIIVAVASCQTDPSAYSDRNGRIQDNVTRVVYFKKTKHFLREQQQQAIEFDDKRSIAEISAMINTASPAVPFKGGEWNEIWLMTPDSVIKISCNHELLGKRGDSIYFRYAEEVFNRYFGGL